MFTSTEQVLWKPIIDSCTERHKARLSQFSQYRGTFKRCSFITFLKNNFLHLAEERYYANVWVQLLFYLNVHFSGVWLISSIVTLYYQVILSAIKNKASKRRHTFIFSTGTYQLFIVFYRYCL